MVAAAPVIYAVLLWWLATGIILFLDGLPRSTFRWSMAGATLMLAGACALLQSSARDPGTGAAYVAFTCAVLLWGWLEMSFLMGFITGPRKHGCPHQCSGLRHFAHATQAIAYNELATLAAAGALWWATREAPNRVALWTFLVLWAMRLSAKLNLFLGVPNLGESLLPAHLQYLRSFFRKRPMNFLFPLSVSGATGVLVWLAMSVRALPDRPSPDAAHATGAALVGSLLALAVLEHWFMVLPLPSEKLWSWALGLRRGAARPGFDGRKQRDAKPGEIRLT